MHSRVGGAPIRDDVGVPVLVFQTETDVSFSNLTARQPDTSTYRLWEVAGTAHYDFYGLSIGPPDTGDGQGAVAVLESMQNPTNQPNPNFTCNSPINTGPAHYVLDAAFDRLNRWVAKGVVPPAAPRLETTGVSPVVFATDANGNVLGGIRTPAVGCTRRDAERCRDGRRLVLLPLRLDGAVHPAQLKCSTPPPQVRVRVDPGDEVGARRQGSSSMPTPRSSSPPRSTPTSGSPQVNTKPTVASPARRPRTAARRSSSCTGPTTRASPVQGLSVRTQPRGIGKRRSG